MGEEVEDLDEITRVKSTSKVPWSISSQEKRCVCGHPLDSHDRHGDGECKCDKMRYSKSASLGEDQELDEIARVKAPTRQSILRGPRENLPERLLRNDR